MFIDNIKLLYHFISKNPLISKIVAGIIAGIIVIIISKRCLSDSKYIDITIFKSKPIVILNYIQFDSLHFSLGDKEWSSKTSPYMTRVDIANSGKLQIDNFFVNINIEPQEKKTLAPLIAIDYKLNIIDVKSITEPNVDVESPEIKTTSPQSLSLAMKTLKSGNKILIFIITDYPVAKVNPVINMQGVEVNVHHKHFEDLTIQQIALYILLVIVIFEVLLTIYYISSKKNWFNEIVYQYGADDIKKEHYKFMEKASDNNISILSNANNGYYAEDWRIFGPYIRLENNGKHRAQFSFRIHSHTRGSFQIDVVHSGTDGKLGSKSLATRHINLSRYPLYGYIKYFVDFNYNGENDLEFRILFPKGKPCIYFRDVKIFKVNKWIIC